MYQCIASNKYGVVATSAQLRVLAFAPSFSKNPIDRRKMAALGSQTIIACSPEAAPFPEFRWTKDGIPVPVANVLSNGNLLIQKVSMEDAGEYMCEASNSKGRASSSGHLYVVPKTVINEGDSTMGVDILFGSSRTVHCKAAAHHMLDLTYVWKKNDVMIDIENDDHYKVGSGASKGDLKISDAGFSQAGKYTCVAKTTVDEATLNVTVRVIGPPGSPGGVQASDATQDSVRLRWSSGNSHGRPIQYYVVEAKSQWHPRWRVVKDRVDGLDKSRESTTVFGLSPGTEHSFRLTAVNMMGKGAPSLPTDRIRTRPAPPARAPGGVGGGGGRVGDLQIRWTPLSRREENGPGIGYVVRWRPLEWNKFVPASVGSPRWLDEVKVQGALKQYVAKVNPEDYYKEYEVQIQAFNHLGFGPNSSVVVIRSAENTPQVAPRSVRGAGSNATAIFVTWRPVELSREGIRGKLLGYKVAFWPSASDFSTAHFSNLSLNHILDSSSSSSSSASSSSFSPKSPVRVVVFANETERSDALLTELRPNTKYSITVMAYNSAGNGPRSDFIRVRTLKSAPQLPPATVQIYSIREDSIKVTWSPVVTDAKYEERLTGYKVRLWSGDTAIPDHTAQDFTILGPHLTECEINNLRYDTIYNLQVMGISRGGDGDLSPPQKFFLRRGSGKQQ